jgi:hypothetical protein
VAPLHRARTPIEVRRAERELFFWTAHQVIKLIALVALVGYLIASVVQGQLPGAQLLQRFF